MTRVAGQDGQWIVGSDAIDTHLKAVLQHDHVMKSQLQQSCDVHQHSVTLGRNGDCIVNKVSNLSTLLRAV
jgi:hypothetical protein